MRPLTSLELRVLGVLIEKQRTVPDTYPLSLNALAAGCSQKTARHPVMEVSDAQVLEALDALKPLNLVIEVSGARVARYEHNLGRVYGVPSQSVALLSTLMLRGPQTAAELRQNAERLHRFADTGSVEAFLDELAASDPPKVRRLERAPGAREARWVHLLGDEPLPEVVAVSSASAVESPALTAEVARLSDELRLLREELADLKRQLGLTP
ncbi:MAG: YceH family protein [Burkholderiales bacterium]|nr:YceH family protein [Burkholderiales bacterium]